MAKVGKRTSAAREAFAGKENLTIEEAVALVKASATAKFDETVEIAVNLGVDPRHADQMVRGVVGLPNGTGKTVRVAVFARGPKAEEAQAAGPRWAARWLWRMRCFWGFGSWSAMIFAWSANAPWCRYKRPF